MPKLLKDPFNDGSKLWAEDMLTTLGLTVDEAVQIEKGENNNGQWVKFSNGLIIAFMLRQITNVSGNNNYNYPIEFTENPVVLQNSMRSGGYEGIFTSLKTRDTTYFQIVPNILTGTVPESGVLSVLAIAIGY